QAPPPPYARLQRQGRGPRSGYALARHQAHRRAGRLPLPRHPDQLRAGPAQGRRPEAEGLHRDPRDRRLDGHRPDRPSQDYPTAAEDDLVRESASPPAPTGAEDCAPRAAMSSDTTRSTSGITSATCLSAITPRKSRIANRYLIHG